MSHRVRVSTWAALLGLAAPLALGQGAHGKPSLQQQVDDLKQGQARLEAELAEIKALLKAQQVARPDPLGALKPTVQQTVNVAGEPFRGDAKARVAILEYSDFDCSFCGHFAREIFPQIDAAYVRTGRIRYFFRDLPSPEHPSAFYKAQVARCAGDQGRFWEMHDRLFADQRGLGPEELDQLTKFLGLDGPTLQACLDQGRYAEAIRRGADAARRMQVGGTPAFLVGTLSEDGSALHVTKVLLGAESFEAFKDMLDDLLAAQPR